MSNEICQKYPPSVQHGKPRLASSKNGWTRVSIGDLVKEASRPVEMKDDEIYTLVTAKRSRGGIVKREDLSGKDIAVKSQFYVKEGDFLISKRQIVHGACGFVPKELDCAIVSNEYLVLNFTDKIIPQFWEFLSHTIYFQQVCFHSSIGVHVEKMLFRVT
jgi:type I restriction enzyme, S subunit